MNKIFVNNIGDLAEAQRASFFRFLCTGISEELINFPNPFITKIKVSGRKKLPCLVYLYTNEIKLKGPNTTIDMCLKRDLSYAIQLYVPGEYSYSVEQKTDEITESKAQDLLLSRSIKRHKLKRIRVKQDIFFGEIPLMTEEGTFIVNGCERIVISQIIRSPGIYFRKEFGTKRKTVYTATIISNKGLWTKFVLDKKEKEEN
jgi:DNA-directed RNA polymerase subunit beta